MEKENKHKSIQTEWISSSYKSLLFLNLNFFSLIFIIIAMLNSYLPLFVCVNINNISKTWYAVYVHMSIWIAGINMNIC